MSEDTVKPDTREADAQSYYQRKADGTLGITGGTDRATIHEANSDPQSHLKGGLFGGDQRKGKILVVSEDEAIATDTDPRNARQTMRRSQAVANVVSEAFINTVPDARGPNIMKIHIDDWSEMQKDPAIETFAQYGSKLMFYMEENGLPDLSRPRPKPLRPILQNEAGIWHHKTKGDIILVFKDAGPGDVGEGKYHQVSEDIS